MNSEHQQVVERALDSLAQHSPPFPPRPAAALLSAPENRGLLLDVIGLPARSDAAAAPGGCTERPATALDRGFHLMLIPAAAPAPGSTIVDDLIAATARRLEQVPELRTSPVAELTVPGAERLAETDDDVPRLLAFVWENFHVTSRTVVRVEHDPHRLTQPLLQRFASARINALTFTVWSLDDELLEAWRWSYRSAEVLDTIGWARNAGISGVDVTLCTGGPGQTLAGVIDDIALLMREPIRQIEHVTTCAWRGIGVAAQLADWRWRPTPLGARFQMHDAVADVLRHHGYHEAPAPFFSKARRGPAAQLTVDPYCPPPCVAIGDVRLAPALPYLRSGSCEACAVARVLASGRPLSDEEHRRRMGSSILEGRWGEKFTDLERRGLVTIDRAPALVILTDAGRAFLPHLVRTEIATHH